MAAWFLSDIHLKTLNERNGILLLRFLTSLKKTNHDKLFLLGDIFDLWVGDHEFYHQKFFPIVEAIFSLKNQGWEVHYFEGNHDLHVKSFWERHGVLCYDDIQYFQLGTKTVRVEHGDFINTSDRAYQRLRSFVRSAPLEMVAQKVPAEGFSKIGEWISQVSRKYSSQERQSKEDSLRKMIREYAENAYSEKPFDLIITGHMHVRDDHTFQRNGQTIRSLNLGSWFDHPSVLRMDDQTLEWVKV